MGTFCIDWMFPNTIQMSRPIQKDDVQIETICCICRATTVLGRPERH